MKNILVSFLGRFNSGPLIAIEIAKALKELDYRVYVIISSHVSNKEEWYKCQFDKIYELDTYQSAKDVVQKTIRLELNEKRKIQKAFADVNFDLIIRPMMHKWDNAVLKAFPTVKVLTYCHDPLPHSGTFAINNWIHERWIKRSDYVVVLTKSFVPIVEKEYGISNENIFCSSHGKLGTYKELQATERPDNLITYDEDKINFMFFGRIEKYKGLGFLLEAYRIVREKYDNCTLTIIGSGDFLEYKSLSEELPDVKVVNRYIADEEVGWCFTGENLVTVLPYTDATQSGVVPIAIEYGIPMIATNTGGLMEQLDDGKIGVFCNPCDLKDLSQKMMRFMEEPDLFMEQKNLMADKLSELDWVAIIDKLMKEIAQKSE